MMWQEADVQWEPVTGFWIVALSDAKGRLLGIGTHETAEIAWERAERDLRYRGERKEG